MKFNPCTFCSGRHLYMIPYHNICWPWIHYFGCKGKQDGPEVHQKRWLKYLPQDILDRNSQYLDDDKALPINRMPGWNVTNQKQLIYKWGTNFHYIYFAIPSAFIPINVHIYFSILQDNRIERVESYAFQNVRCSQGQAKM